MSAQEEVTEDDESTFAAERPKAFIDAVVAIAMTLLILPLMESVGEFVRDAQTGAQALDWFGEHRWELTSFIVSFAVIGMFWVTHFRLFSRVKRFNLSLLWLCIIWLATIVWLPVATALAGALSQNDPSAKVVYIGSMILTAFASVGVRIYLLRHPTMHSIPRFASRRGITAELVTAALFGVALTASLIFPSLGYYTLFAMFLSGPVQRLVGPRRRSPDPHAG